MKSLSSFLIVNLVYGGIVFSIVLRSFWFDGKGGLVPLVIGIPTLVLIVLVLLSRCRNAGRESTAVASKDGDVAPWERAKPVVGWLCALMGVLFFIGFYPSLFLFTFAYMRFSANTSYTVALGMSASLLLVIYASFEWMLQRPLFEGVFFGAVLPLL